MAFDKAIERVSKRLASSGVADEEIWAAFRKATNTMGRLAIDVDEGDQPLGCALKNDMRSRRLTAANCRQQRAGLRSGRRKTNG